jgi:hypothetical protein
MDTEVKRRQHNRGIALGGLMENNTEAVKEYFGALRPWVAVLVVLSYVAPFVAAIAYTRTLSERDSMLFWLGSSSYVRFGLAWFAMIWFSQALVFTITRIARLRPLFLNQGADHGAFDRRSRDSFIITSVLLVLYLVVECFLEWS